MVFKVYKLYEWQTRQRTCSNQIYPFQLTSCIQKIINIPITTHTHFDFNETLLYPSVTFCREPPYKHAELEKHGLYSHPYYTSTWRNFDFQNVSLDDLWNDITYTDSEFFVQYGIDSLSRNVEVNSTTGLTYGRCYTLSSKILLSKASKSTGYSITLQHSSDDIMNSISINPPGYHVFVHYTREPFTEIDVNNGGLIEYLYVYPGEEVDVKITVDKYDMMSKEGDECTHNYENNYSANKCTTKCVWELVEEVAGCSGPWMNSTLPRCRNYARMRSLISAYIRLQNEHTCSNCPRFCRSYLYNVFVVNRQNNLMWDTTAKSWEVRRGEVAYQTTLYIYFNSKLVSVYEETYNYDWNNFLSDVGGSVGFLLGLSVIGFITIFGKIWSTVIMFFMKSPSRENCSIESGSTVPIGKMPQEKTDTYVEKFNEWNKRNAENNGK